MLKNLCASPPPACSFALGSLLNRVIHSVRRCGRVMYRGGPATLEGTVTSPHPRCTVSQEWLWLSHHCDLLGKSCLILLDVPKNIWLWESFSEGQILSSSTFVTSVIECQKWLKMRLCVSCYSGQQLNDCSG